MSIRWPRTLLALSLLGTGWLTSSPSARSDGPFASILLQNVRVPMRDGVQLATNVWLPAKDGQRASGRFPVVLERTPYDKDTSQDLAQLFVPHGYVFVSQDVRGRFASEGRWRPHQDDGPDGFDTAAWIGEQSWFEGGIGTVGTSYPGGTQHALALANPPHLKALVPVDAMSNYGRYGIRHNGAFELRFFNWIFHFGFAPRPVRQPNLDEAAGPALGRLRDEVRDYVRALPLRRGTTPLALAPDYEEWLVEAMRHGGNDAFWRDMGASVVDHLDDYKDVPVYHVGGWYDSWAAQTANLNYHELRRSKKSLQRLVMGPWTHGGQERTFAGMAEFGPEAAIDLGAFHVRWFDRWLKGEDNGVDREPPVRIFVMGGGDGHKTPEGRLFVGGQWRDEPEWPLSRAKATPFYLQADGRLAPDLPGDVAPTRYLFDPKRPVPTIGGNISSETGLMGRGAQDQVCAPEILGCEDRRPLAARNDVLVFQTAPLDEALEVTGRILVKLWITSSRPDTDFTAKLVDVWPPSRDFPTGTALLVGDSIVRARFREGLDHEAAPIVPGRAYPVTIELYPTSLVFGKGHRIRLDVSSSNFPRFDVNPNTGEPLNDNRRWLVAENAIFHDAERASHLLLPVVPAAR
ncbi:MAG TPA: CocE/NonD family hydrolase [Vicinamibacteria bacterium]